MFQIAENPVSKLVFRTPWIGIFQSYSEAVAAIPLSMRVGYGHESIARVFRNYPLTLVRPADYPILLHLGHLLRAGSRVIDFGGNIGMACYLADRYLKLPSPCSWVICDLPAMIAAARQVAQRERTLTNILEYATDIEDAGECDVFFSSGTLHHLDVALTDLLRKLPALPRSVLVNRIPVWERSAITTVAVHFDTKCATPARIFNRAQFTSAMEQLGYRLMDDWECPESSMSVRFHPRIRLNAYHGFYFSRIARETHSEQQRNAAGRARPRSQKVKQNC